MLSNAKVPPTDREKKAFQRSIEMKHFLCHGQFLLKKMDKYSIVGNQ